MPLGDGRALTLDHTVPVSDLISARGLHSHHYSTHQVVLALRVVVPHCDDYATLVELISTDVEAHGLVKDGVDRVLFDRRLLCLYRLLSLEQAHLYEGICKEAETLLHGVTSVFLSFFSFFFWRKQGLRASRCRSHVTTLV